MIQDKISNVTKKPQLLYMPITIKYMCFIQRPDPAIVLQIEIPLKSRGILLKSL